MEIQIVSGFLGAGKTTFINKYLPCLEGKTVVIENEFGSMGLDGDLIKNVEVKEIYAGCICCSLKDDFEAGIREIYEKFNPDRILIEPSGVAKLTEVEEAAEKALENLGLEKAINKRIVIVDAESFEDFSEEFGPFYMDQVENGNLILLSNLDQISEEDLTRIEEKIRDKNPDSLIFTGDFRELDSQALKNLVEMSEGIKTKTLIESHDHHECSCGHHHHHEGSCSCGHDHHHHHHDHDHHDHVHGQEADFLSYSYDGLKFDTIEDLKEAVEKVSKADLYGKILRLKAIFYDKDQKGYLINYTPYLTKIEAIEEGYKARLIVIGLRLNDQELKKIFG